MSLDQWSKISDILFKALVTAFIAVITLYLTWQKNSSETVRQCDATYAALIDYASKTKFSDTIQQHINFRIANYNEICPRTIDPTRQQSIISMLLIDPATTAAQLNITDGLKGWVALSRIPAKDYGDTNFDVISGGSIFSPNAIIRSRWTVNVREKNTPVANGDNRIIGVLQGSACVKIEKRESGQLNEWALITEQKCPN